ncbi:MAG: FtsQ-type POTRA domain-containing protein [Clostridiales bacterium]|nr:FtsQ-type POTRA domain-containing protein [Clostridiales bacterium]
MGKDGDKRNLTRKPDAKASGSSRSKNAANVSQFVPRKTKGITYNPNHISEASTATKKYSTSSKPSAKPSNVEYFNNTKRVPQSKKSDQPTVSKPKPSVRTTNPNIAYKEATPKAKRSATTPTKASPKRKPTPKTSKKPDRYVIDTTNEGVIRVKNQPVRQDKPSAQRVKRLQAPESVPQERVKRVKKKKALSPEMKKLRRERARKAFRIVSALFIAAVLGVGAYFISSFLFKIESIAVSGNTKFESDYIIRLSGLKVGDNLLFSNTNDATNNLSQNPYIVAKITKRLPNRIVIEITERNECAIIATNLGYAAIDIDGNVLYIEDSNTLPELLKITGMESVCLQVGKRIAPQSDYRAKTLLLLISEIISGEFYTIVSEVNISNPLAIEMLSTSNYEVYFGDTESIVKKLENLRGVLSKISDLGAGRIDVSCVDRPAFIPEESVSPSPTIDGDGETETPENTLEPTETPEETIFESPTPQS